MMKRFLLYHLPAILYGVLIIVLSSLPRLGIPNVKFLQMDKILHFIEYAVFAVLIYRSFSHISDSFQGRLMLLLSMFFVVLFALFDEYYQSYIPGRQSDPLDLLFDVLGALMIITYLFLRKRSNFRRSAAE